MDQHESNVAVSGNAMNKIFEMEDDENKFNNANTIKRIPYNFSTKESCYETIFECQQQRTSDESFMALEKMCDKTASDPDSTLFKYIHSENKDMVIEDVKKRSADGNYFKTPCKQELQEIDEEAQSLQRLLHDLCVQEQHQLDNETPLKSIDVTLLEDIEAPSKMWDSTIVGDTTLQTSPVKMVGLLRPSTILEDNCEDQSNSSLGGDDLSSHISFQSAQKCRETSTTTSCYETAHDTTGASAPRKVSHYTQSRSAGESHELEESIILINLDNTLEPPANEHATVTELITNDNKNMHGSEKLSSSASFDDSLGVIELSDDESDETGGNLNKSVFIKEEKEQQQKEIAIEPIVRNAEIMLSNYQNKSSIEFEESFENDKENRSLFNESTEKSLHFNDTMEEVEYMMKKGMQYMQAAEPTTKLGNLSPIVNEAQMVMKPLQEREKTFTYSPKKAKSNCGSPAKKFINRKPTAVVTGTKAKTPFSSPKRTPLTSTQKTNRFVMSMKPVPKLELFKKPQTAMPTRLKENTGPKQFSHIVSPVGAYMKNTATTPLMSNLKQRPERPDVRNATVFRELEQESRTYQPKFALTGNTITKTSSLPKKAYISSEFKHIVDERTPVTIPGGKSIQKYLENAMLPTVVRHEGKLKMTGKDGNRKTVSNKTSFGGNTTQRNNGSLADLSLMSGDISVYTMKDARKF
ncbi:uncharacterized protein sip2 isoform X2 [Eurosta solidaginis]